mgnify:CR=1 FL=1
MSIFGGTKKKEKKAKAAVVRHARTTKTAHGIAHEIISAPWFSEKALIMTEKGVYTFEVPARATKAMIAGAIKEIYNVEPRAIRVLTVPGKRKMMRTKRGIGQRAARRKAYVYLNAGDTIQFA